MEQQSFADAIGNLVTSVFLLLAGPTIILLLLRRYLPMLGDPLWRAYCQLLTLLVVAPIRLVRLLIREAMGRRHR